MEQPLLFDVMAPPPKPSPKAPTPELSSEEIFYRRLYERPTTRIYLCPYCEKPYHCISYHLLRECAADWDGRKEEVAEAISPLPQEETPQIERSENVPGPYAYKSKGVDKAEVMHPDYRPTQKETATAAITQARKPALPKETHIDLQEAGTSTVSQQRTLNDKPEEKVSEGPTLKVKLAPHFWHWVRSKPLEKVMIKTKKGTEEAFLHPKDQERYTPSLTVRRRSIPAIACSLYYSVELSALTMLALSTSQPQYYGVNKIFYELDKKKVERFIKLLVFCGLEEDRIRWWVREAWTAAKTAPLHPWVDTKIKDKDGNVIETKKGAGPALLGLLGYQLADGESDGFGDDGLASLGDFLQEEGYKGR